MAEKKEREIIVPVGAVALVALAAWVWWRAQR